MAKFTPLTVGQLKELISSLPDGLPVAVATSDLGNPADLAGVVTGFVGTGDRFLREQPPKVALLFGLGYNPFYYDAEAVE